jgi:hypothetical protein
VNGDSSPTRISYVAVHSINFKAFFGSATLPTTLWFTMENTPEYGKSLGCAAF